MVCIEEEIGRLRLATKFVDRSEIWGHNNSPSLLHTRRGSLASVLLTFRHLNHRDVVLNLPSKPQ